jgi:hypothetical protein
MSRPVRPTPRWGWGSPRWCSRNRRSSIRGTTPSIPSNSRLLRGWNKKVFVSLFEDLLLVQFQIGVITYKSLLSNISSFLHFVSYLLRRIENYSLWRISLCWKTERNIKTGFWITTFNYTFITKIDIAALTPRPMEDLEVFANEKQTASWLGVRLG